MKPTDLNLTSTPQLSNLGRPYRLSAILKNGQLPSKWIDRVECWHFYYIFKYTDEHTFFAFEFDYNDNFIQKFNHVETLNLFNL
jgi:hypothetical protein